MRKSNKPFRYYMSGEYGGKFQRAHYHACIFGQNFTEDRLPTRQSQSGNNQWISPELDKLWGKGLTTISQLCPETALYTAKYIMKKKTGEQGKQEYGDRKPPYNTMSLKPGIGFAWYAKYKGDLYPDDFCIRNGQKLRVPTFYDRLLEKEDPKAYEAIKSARHARASQANWNPDRRHAKQIILESQQNLRS